MTIYRLSTEPILPNPRQVSDPDGLLAVGGDLSPLRLIRAYRAGIFPWFNAQDPYLWWSPPRRAVFFPHSERLSTRTRRAIRNSGFEMRVDTCFHEVIRGCREVPRQGQEGTWITEEVVEAYHVLHAMGYAHSFETFHEGKLVGGLYGLSFGGMFCGESMFAHVDYASRAAFQALCQRAWSWGFHFVDGQLPNSNLLGLGAATLLREEFLDRLDAAMAEPTRRGRWSLT